MYRKQDLKADLLALGVKQTDTLLVHSSCKGQYRRFLVSRSLDPDIGLIVVGRSR